MSHFVALHMSPVGTNQTCHWRRAMSESGHRSKMMSTNTSSPFNPRKEPAKTPARQAGFVERADFNIIGLGVAKLDVTSLQAAGEDVGEGVGKEPNVCTDVDGNPAAWHQLGKDREFGLACACLLRDTPPVED
jgi:hypothetical protein